VTDQTSTVTAETRPASSAFGGGKAASYRQQGLLILLTLACLLPFSGKAVHMDDPLFLWSAKQIVQHPLDPYGFPVVWYLTRMPMSEVTQNPPLASYYAALIGAVAGWSERALHLGFIVPAIVGVLGTYRLALRFTARPMLAAAATLLAPGFLVSATGLMCDVMMLALWMLAIIFWIEGLEEPVKPRYLAISALLIAACALTKYFGVSLIPLLLLYSLVRRRRVGAWIAYLLIPLAVLGCYELYTQHLYGHGLIYNALHYQTPVRRLETPLGRLLVGLSFAGGCTLPALAFVPWLWSRRQIVIGGATSIFIGAVFFEGWMNLGRIYAYEKWVHDHKLLITTQLIFYVAGGISLLCLAAADYRKNRDAASLLLLLWVTGTMVFAIALNWNVNARSLLPLIPAVAILIARRLDLARPAATLRGSAVFVIPLIVSGAFSLWVAAGDAALADSSRRMANMVREKTRTDAGTVRFEGHWGFQYYLESFGAKPIQSDALGGNFGDLIVLPMYNTSTFAYPLKTTAQQTADLDVPTWITTMNPDAGAGFYFSGWGPLPFAIGPVPEQRYLMGRLVQAK